MLIVFQKCDELSYKDACLLLVFETVLREVDMELADKLVIVLSEQAALYRDMESIEQQKKEIIIARDGKELERLVSRQEKIITEIDILEKRRIKIMDDISFSSGRREPVITARQAAVCSDRRSGELIIRYANELRNIVKRIKKLSDVNERCMKDNMEFFTWIIDSLRQTVGGEEGYSASGVAPRRSAESALFNLTV